MRSPEHPQHGDWIADVPLSDSIFDKLFTEAGQRPQEEPPADSEHPDD